MDCTGFYLPKITFDTSDECVYAILDLIKSGTIIVIPSDDENYDKYLLLEGKNLNLDALPFTELHYREIKKTIVCPMFYLLPITSKTSKKCIKALSDLLESEIFFKIPSDVENYDRYLLLEGNDVRLNVLPFTELLHREFEPSIIWNKFYMEWYLGGVSHNEHGAAIVHRDGKEYYLYGLPHREGAPAIDWVNKKIYYEHGVLQVEKTRQAKRAEKAKKAEQAKKTK